MEKALMCRELGLDGDCGYEARGETTSDVLGQILKHILANHEMDWFELEEVHVTALACMRNRAA